MKRIKILGTGADMPKDDVHFESFDGNDYTLCGETLDGDPETVGDYESTTDKVNCKTCIDLVKTFKKVKRSEYI